MSTTIGEWKRELENCSANKRNTGMDVNKHKFFMMQVLKDVYSDRELANCLGFKGGTALMFFYGLPRFSYHKYNIIQSANRYYSYFSKYQL